MLFIVPEDWGQVHVGIAIHMLADPLAHAGVEVSQLMQVLARVGRGGAGLEARVGRASFEADQARGRSSWTSSKAEWL